MSTTEAWCSTGDGTVLAVGAARRRLRGVDWCEASPFHRESMTAYGEERYSDALEAIPSKLFAERVDLGRRRAGPSEGL
jgi:hypothetical protein